MRARVHLLTVGHVAVGLVMAAAGVVETLGRPETVDMPPLGVVLPAILGFVAVLVARWAPVVGLAVVLAEIATPALLGLYDRGAGGTQLILLMLLTGNAAYRHRARVSLPAYATAVLVPTTLIIAAGGEPWELLFFALFLGTAWTLGALLRRERHRSDELTALAEALRAERERATEVAVTAERTRIAQELHDAVAHDVSVMTLQVGVLRHRLRDRPDVERALRDAEELGRRSVDELRHLVGIMRAGQETDLTPVPSLAHLDALCERVRGAGSPVTVRRSGQGSEPTPEVDRAAYRIVQESLTNALKHAPGASVEVVLDSGADHLSLTVRDDGRGGADPGLGSGGLGLPGMRERAASVGGSLEAHATDDGFEVRARLPLVPAAAPVEAEGLVR